TLLKSRSVRVYGPPVSGPGALKLAAATCAACLLAAAQAGAVVPTGNLLTNGDAEGGSGASDSMTVYNPPGWDVIGSKITGVRWGAPGGFPTAEQGTALGGGVNFFAGGPAETNDNDSLGYRNRTLRQQISLPPQAFADIDAGGVVSAFTACLGGYANQDDSVSANVAFYSEANGLLSVLTVNGPTAAQRQDRTGLLPEVGSSAVPAGGRKAAAHVDSPRASADNEPYK